MLRLLTIGELTKIVIHEEVRKNKLPNVQTDVITGLLEVTLQVFILYNHFLFTLLSMKLHMRSQRDMLVL